MGEDLNKYFSKRDIEVASRYIEKILMLKRLGRVEGNRG